MLFFTVWPAPECRSSGGFSALREKAGGARRVRGRERHGSKYCTAKRVIFLLCPLALGEAISLPKNLRRTRKGRTLSNLQTYQAACTMGQDDFCGERAHFQSPNRFLAVFAPGNPKDFSKNWLGRLAGEQAPRPRACRKVFNRLSWRSHQPAEKLLESSKRPNPFEFTNISSSVYGWGKTTFCGERAHFPEQQSFPCGFCARKSDRFLAKTGWGGWRESKLPVHKPVKKFLTGCHGEEGEAVNLPPLWTCSPSLRFREESFFCLFGMA